MIKNRNYLLDIFVISYALLGLFGLFGVSINYAVSQAYFIVFALVLYLAISILNKQYTQIFVYLTYVVLILLLLYLQIFGRAVRGSASWVDFGLFNFQPSEFAKFVVLFIVSDIFARRINTIKKFLFLGIAVLPLNLLVLFQPDFGMFFLISLITVFVIFASSMNKKGFVFLTCFLVLFSFILFGFLKDYQKGRITSFFNQQADLRGKNYNVYQSQIAIGSAPFFGKGLNYNTQVRLGFLPESHTDFAFAASIETYGLFFGLVFFLAFFSLTLFLLFKFVFSATSSFGLNYSFGLFALFVVQTLLNIGMNLGAFPVSGLTLPFLSYGGSSLLTYFCLFAYLHKV